MKKLDQLANWSNFLLTPKQIANYICALIRVVRICKIQGFEI